MYCQQRELLIKRNKNRQTMNTRIYIVIVGLLALIGGANAQTLSVGTVEGKVGEQTTMTVSLADAAAATALQFNLSLPENVTINESGCALGNAATNHTLSVNKMDNGNYLFVMYSMDFTALTDGTLLTIPVTIGNGAATGNGNLNTVRSAKSDAVSQQHQNASFAVNVTTAVEGIKSDIKKDAVIYNVKGQKLTSPQKGINIVGGKKVIVK